MSNETFEVGTKITVVAVNSAYPKWTLYVKPGNRTLGARGRVVGFFRLSMVSLFAVAHDDGSKGVYEADELRSTTTESEV